MDRISAIASTPDGLTIKDLPKAKQIAICEQILKCPPNRDVQLWAGSLLIALTEEPKS